MRFAKLREGFFGDRSARVAVAGTLALVLLSTAIHWPSADAHFSYDDRDFVERNQSIRSLAGAAGAFFSPFPAEQPERGLYRPLTNASYALDYAVWGPSAHGFHVTNVLLYAWVVIAVLALAYIYVPSLAFAGAVGLLFALHPVHSEAVDSVAGRSELLSLFFSLASLLLFLRSLRLASSATATAASAACLALACLSKESSAVLPAVLAVHALVFTAWPPYTTAARKLAACLRRVAPQLAVVAIYCALRIVSLGRFSPEQTVLGDAELSARLHTMGAVFAEYGRLLVYPRALHVDYFYQQDPGIALTASLQSTTGMALLCSLVATAVFLGVRELRRSGRPDFGSLALCAFAIAFGFFAPVSHLLDFGALLAERFLFAPSLGFVLLATLPCWWLLRRSGAPLRSAAALLLLGLSIAGALRSQARAQEWRDEVALWSQEATATPDDPRVLANLGAAHLRRGNYDAARRELARTLKLDPAHLSALNNLAFANLQTGRLHESAERYRQTIALDPRDFVAWNGLGVIAARRGEAARAAELFERAIAINPNYATARRNFEGARSAAQSARQFVESRRAAAQASDDPGLLDAVARACLAAGDASCAEAFAQRALAHR